jgi:hypothetical protein
VPAGQDSFRHCIEFRFIVEIVHCAMGTVDELTPESGHLCGRAFRVTENDHGGTKRNCGVRDAVIASSTNSEKGGFGAVSPNS